MYEEYYGFVQPPFSLTPDPRFLYRSESHDIALQQVWQAIRRKEGFVVLTGDIGTGKTTLCRTLLEQFDPSTFAALILNPFLSVEELLREVMLGFGIASKETLHTGRLATASKHELVRTLHDFLLSLVPLKGSAVLIVDEAQHLSGDVLEEIRILSNLETNEQKLLQIILAGQLNLLDTLHDAKLRQLDQRISIRCLLKPLNREEVEAYITHRLWVARGSTAVGFTPDAIDLVHALSEGVPRRINLICDRALMAGYRAQSEKIGPVHVQEAATALDITIPRAAQQRHAMRRTVRRTWRAAAVVALVLVISLLAYFVYAFGNPIAFLGGLSLPAAPTTTPSLSLPLAPHAPDPPETTIALVPPPLGTSGYSVFVAAFDAPRAAAQAESTLRAHNLPVYAIDVRASDGGVRRRLFVGRFASRQQADAVRDRVAPLFTSARVTTPQQERLP
jgi:general secretion pathway protein A